MTYKIGKGLPLREHLEHCKNNAPSSEWMISDEEEYSMDMMVYPVYLESWEMEPDAFEVLEEEVLSQGYGNILTLDQIQDVIENLRLQRPFYSHGQLEHALNHYSNNDVFIELSSM